eukprot:CAMPEP_0174878644 /NCGR_PEP_ID=MMETSP1114-20130205/82861_1 /TAXON_ID=312471 /ORGANISM="Neobodo designis, Strain CCAP 1951/1" /LENGTH=2292 /DNA_ID=CAMNT_0016114033 /DNA_START=739 /DNA_END=7617 /DNA_ORIENTATION=-
MAGKETAEASGGAATDNATSVGNGKAPAQREFSVIDANASGEQLEYASNEIKTTKYTIFPWRLHFFLWRMLYEQFQRKANLYFLVVGCMQLVPGLSPTGRYTTLSTLIGVLLFSMAKSGYEDVGRYRKDGEVNSRKVWVLHDAAENVWVEKNYTDIVVGDIVRVTNMDDEHGNRRNDIPCDIAMLSSSDPDGIAYVETANLDGETNLKARRCLDETRIAASVDLEAVAEACSIKYEGARVQCEVPNNSLYTFTGRLFLKGATESLRLTPDQMLYRGCLLRKVHWVVGICVFTGPETKIMMNARKPPHKASRVEKLINRLLFFILSIQLVLCVIGTLGLYFSESDAWFLGPSDSRDRSQEAGLGFLTFIILFNNLIPISLYVSIEFVKVFQGLLLEQDLAMYYEPKDMRASAKTTDLNEELGQIEYVFSDKTGTLTRNVMTFMKFSLPDGAVYGEGTTEIGRAAAHRMGRKVEDNRPPEVIESDNPFWDERINDDRWLGAPYADDIRRLFTLLAVCHTVVVDNGKYEAESPDEEALVKAARHFGFHFVNRQMGSITIELGIGEPAEYQVLDIIEFNSDRKRMSLIVKCPDGTVKLMTKGADSTMFPRIRNGTDIVSTEKALKGFGDDGLRTLVLAEKVLPSGVWEPWVKKNGEAKNIIGDDERKAALLVEYAAEIEVDLELVGTTAIEDKLQEGVPQTIEALRTAGMKVWMLTGDKMETAINIGYACALLHDNMQKIQLDSTMRTKDLLENLVFKDDDGGLDRGIIVDGDSLTRIFNDEELKHKFVDATATCTSVVCCRVSPKQKADVVEMVRTDKPDATTLSIGDGANDVPMIQAAHVGVGISGMEGQQAANSADYAIGQFRYLHRLTLVHGRVNYYRLCLLIRYFFYKNAVVVITQFWFCLFNLFTGQSLYENWTLAAYNVFFTSLPVVIVGIYDRDILNTDNIHDHPKLYQDGLNDELLNFKVFAQWIFNAIFHSAIIFFVVMFGWGAAMGKEGVILGLDGVGVTMYATVIVVANLKLALHVSSFTWMHYLSFAISIIGFFFFLAVYGAFPATFSTVAYQQLENIGFQLSPWIFFFIGTALCLARDFLWRYAEYNFVPIASLPLRIKIQYKDDQNPRAAIQPCLELRQRREGGYKMGDVMGKSKDMANLFAEYDAEAVVIDPAQDLFMQFVDREIEDEFVDQHIGNLSRYKIGLGMCAVASLVIVLNFASQYNSGDATELEIGTWALFSAAAWLCFVVISCSGERIKPHLHSLMSTLMLVGFSGMTIANLVRADIDEDTHPVTLGVILFGLLTVVRPPVVHALHYIIISFMCYIVWYQAFRVRAWGIGDFMLRFVELIVIAVTSFVTLAVTESFLRRMFISQKQVAATKDAASNEEERSLRLLGNVLPSAVVKDIRANKGRQLSEYAVTYKRASLLNSDIVKFTAFSSTKEPHVVVEMLNKMFTKFDASASSLGLEKIKTIGDAYVCAAGVPVADPLHQRKIVLMGLSMVHSIKQLNAEGLTSLRELNIAIRIGAATGPVQAGVIGMEKVSFDVFGHVAEESELMEQTGLPDRIQASPALYEATKNHFDYETLEIDGVTRYFACNMDDVPLDTPRSSSDGRVLVNNLHRDDVYKLLEDDDEERREIINTYSDFNGDMNGLTLNFQTQYDDDNEGDAAEDAEVASDGHASDAGQDINASMAESFSGAMPPPAQLTDEQKEQRKRQRELTDKLAEGEFRLHLRTIANTRFNVEGGMATFLFVATFILIALAVSSTNVIGVVILVIGLGHLLAVAIRHCWRKRNRNLRRQRKAEAKLRESREMETARNRRKSSAAAPVPMATNDDDSDASTDSDEEVDADTASVCTPVRAWCTVSGIIAYLVPIAVLMAVLWSNPKGSPTIVVFIVLGVNIYVLSFLHMRFWAKVAISTVHFILILACYMALLTYGDGRSFSSGEAGGDLFAIVLCYVLGWVSAYTQERSVRQSFAAAKRLVYQNAEVMSAIDLCDKLLNNVLPRSIVRRLKSSPGTYIVDEVPEASCMFIYTEGLRPEEGIRGKSTGDIVADMNEFLWLMDSLCVHHKVEKIKTTPFLIVSGCPEPVRDHVRRLCILARDMVTITNTYNMHTGSDIRVRVGIHTGKVTAGVLGSTKFLYDIFGDTVNLASRMTSSAQWGDIQLSEVSRKAIGGEFGTIARGEVELKGKGKQPVFLLDVDDQRMRNIPLPDLLGNKRIAEHQAGGNMVTSIKIADMSVSGQLSPMRVVTATNAEGTGTVRQPLAEPPSPVHTPRGGDAVSDRPDADDDVRSGESPPGTVAPES